MTVIADTSPLQYAVEIDAAQTLFKLYGRIVVPAEAYSEMLHPGVPLALRFWVKQNLRNIEVQSLQVPGNPRLALLDPGEMEAIVLAEQLFGSPLIIDDADGRREALRRGLRIIGLLGVIRDASLRGFLDFDEAIQKLRNTAPRHRKESERPKGTVLVAFLRFRRRSEQ